MTLANIPIDVQPFIELNYEYNVKLILLVGWWLFALFYLMYWHKQQKPTKIFLLGTFRASMYVTAWLYSWLFWLIFPVFIHPNVPIDNLLLFLGYAYTGISTVFFVMFVFNFTVWLPKFIYHFGKLDFTGFEDSAIEEYFGKDGMQKWLKTGRK